MYNMLDTRLWRKKKGKQKKEQKQKMRVKLTCKCGKEIVFDVKGKIIFPDGSSYTEI